MGKKDDEAIIALSQSINKAINISLSEAPFDITVRGLVKERLYEGYYKVDIDGNEYKAHSDMFFNEGDFVNVLYPQNSPSNMQIIPSKPSDYGEYEYTQDTPSTRWEMVHNLNRIPFVVVVADVGGIDGLVIQPASIQHKSKNATIITFSSAQKGKAILR